MTVRPVLLAGVRDAAAFWNKGSISSPVFTDGKALHFGVMASSEVYHLAVFSYRDV